MSDHPDPGRTAPEAEGQLVAPAPVPASLPAHVGRYRVERLLGQGGFGRVYLAYDDQLQRRVAVKLPRPERVARPEDADGYLAEARALARLDHPNIVPVHDVGRTDDGLPFVVSKFIEGTDLAATLPQARPSCSAAAALVATVAEALHHAHRQGLVHRDVKPGNILLDAGGTPYVVDFGLALREEDFGKEAGHVGTPAYMSPEQARGEGHRVDGRSDVFSLGVVFYELLTGRRPFRGETREEFLEQVTAAEPRPPRQVDDAIPRELERVCLKALAKRAAERYLTAKDLADDLRHFLAGAAPAEPPRAPAGVAAAAPVTPTFTPPVRVVPKGLRSFDAHDADFFLELLPGPRDRDGLPDSVRFWKARIEESDPDDTFPVGLLYGPSGCGKSSLVKAGLLPRLAGHVAAVYVEATADDTEARLLKGLRKHCPDLAADVGLTQTVAALRRGQGMPAGRKVLLVLDQFEQWLHARRAEDNTELVQALRQCDGGRVQCVVLVRDDFWLAVSRFVRELEVDLVPGRNIALVDLFDRDHARRVLAAFGRAFGKLPEWPAAPAKEQAEFLRQAVAGLAQEGKVVCVRLALFAEMLKGRPWTPASLKEVGGTEGVGVTFLEETFAAPTANPRHRLHQRAARAVLQALLPEAGTDIKGHMRSEAELLAASGYANRPRDFEDMLRILDGELRLITPTDPEGQDDASQARSASAGRGTSGAPGLSGAGRYYQLTHDYLVPSLRDWLTRKQKETRRGRAELRLAERAALWHNKPENRHLPSGWEWANIRLLTATKDWTPPQRRMMRQATRSHALRAAALLLVLVLLGWGGYEGYGALGAEHLVTADTADVPRLVAQLPPYSRCANALLRRHLQDSPEDSKEHLHASLALAPGDGSQVEYLSRQLLRAGPVELAIIRDALWPYRAALGERLWGVLEDRNGDPDQRLRAACALARYAPDDARWAKVGGDVAAKLVRENALVLGQWVDALRPVGGVLLPALATFLEDDRRSAEQRRTIAGVYGTYAADTPDALAPLEKRLAEASEPNAPDDAKLALARRQANLGVALLLLGRPDEVWPLLKHSPDPTRRSYLIDRLAPGGVAARVLIDRLDGRTEVSIRRALVLALGEYDPERLPPAEGADLSARLTAMYRDDPDPGVHGAAAWLLRQWGQQGKVEGIDRSLATGKVEGGRQWYVNGQGQTLVLVPPGEFETGEGNQRVTVGVGRRFALAAREVTVAEFRRFRKDHAYSKEWAPTEDCPAIGVSWYDAAHYCNWLSAKEGIAEDQRCYVPNEKGEYAAGMKVKANALGLSGYRLPAEAEWELACRAGSVTGWSMGEGEDLLGKYAWYVANSPGRSRPVGSLRPNDLGLFDLHGNAWEWCQNRFEQSSEMKDQHLEDKVDDSSGRPLRGGSFHYDPLVVRSAYRYRREPAGGNRNFGFRPARTVPP